MKKIFIFTACILFWACSSNVIHGNEDGTEGKDDATLQSLTGTKWKLAGIVDTKTGVLRELEPKNCEKCYSFTFDTDSTAYGNSIVNMIGVELTPILKIIVLTEAYDSDISDAALFYNAIQSINSYDQNKDLLKFYYNENKNYLLFKQVKP